MSSVPERSEIDTEYTWDLGDLFESEDEWEDAYDTLEGRLDELREYEGHVTENGETLLAALSTFEDVMRQVATVVSYASLRSDEDTTNQEYQALSTRASSLATDARSAASYLEPAIQDVGREQIESMMAETPELEEYDHFFDDALRMKPHTRSAEIENLIAELSEVTGGAGDVYSMLSNADMDFGSVEDEAGESVEITVSNFTTLQRRPDREFRQSVYERYYDEWGDVRNAVATAYENSVKADVKLAQARGYDTARQAALDGPNVPATVYDTLVETVRDNLDPLHRHLDLKREHLGVEDLRMWDVYMPLAEGDPEIPYADAKQYVTEALAPLGEDYRDRVATGLDSRWVDVYENAGKRSGAYSSGTYDSQPYILMNYHDDVDSLYTLAHEMGHSMHSELASEAQPYVYSNYTLFIAEIASTVNETLLTHHLLETLEDETLRRHVLNQSLERFRTTLCRQTMFADFEQAAHEVIEGGGALTPDRLDDLYRERKGAFYEPAVVDDRIATEWMRIPHFYRAFYVYQYATGISAAVALADRIIEEGESAVADYRTFLSRGSRAYPMELLSDAGVDLTTQEAFEAAFSTYSDRLDAFSSLQ